MLKCLLVSPLPGMKIPKCREMSVLLGLCRAEIFVPAHRLTGGQLGGYSYSAISNKHFLKATKQISSSNPPLNILFKVEQVSFLWNFRNNNSYYWLSNPFKIQLHKFSSLRDTKNIHSTLQIQDKVLVFIFPTARFIMEQDHNPQFLLSLNFLL